MNKGIVTSLILLAAFLVAVGSVVAQDPDFAPVLGDFRVDVETNRNVYHNADVLRLTVKLLNDSPGPVHLMQVEYPIPLDTGGDEVVAASLDDDAVDIVIWPYWPTAIGYARLTPLGFNSRIMMAGGDAAMPEIAMPEIAYRLPLFGSPVVPAHSTRIISTANIFISCPVPVPVDPVPVPEPVDVEGSTATDERPQIDGVGKYYAIRPGRYLLEVNIDKIVGVSLAQAQKIIIIRPRTVNRTIRLLRDNNAGIRRIDRRTEAMAEVARKNLMNAIYSNRYIRAIYRLLTGDTPTEPIAPTKSETTLRKKSRTR